MDRIAACKGGGLVLDADFSMQLVTSPELQALVCEAGLPVELHFDSDCSPLLRDDMLRLSVPVRHRPDGSNGLHQCSCPCHWTSSLGHMLPHVCQPVSSHWRGYILFFILVYLQVLSVRWHTWCADAWDLLDNCAKPAHGVAAIHGLQLPFKEGEGGDAARNFAAKICNLRAVCAQYEGQASGLPLAGIAPDRVSQS